MKEVLTILNQYADKEYSQKVKRFFKSKKTNLKNKEIFLGIKNPVLRKISKDFIDINFKNIEQLLKTNLHEAKMLALMILVLKYKKSKCENLQNEIYNFYLKNTKYINNWDLVDGSAPYIVGVFLLTKKNRTVLYELARSNNFWERRISIVATWWFIRNNSFKDTLKISKILLEDEEDLIQKAVGWMLKEVSKRDNILIENFIQKNYKKIKRTTLRYAIEKLEPRKRKLFLQGVFK